MLTVYSEKHALHNPRGELCGGELVVPFECPARVEHILQRVKKVALGDIIAPGNFGIEAVARVHDPAYVRFLESCWRQWSAAGYRGDAIATVWPARGMQQRIPEHIEGKLGYYALACETAITRGTWEAARASVDVALTAQAALRDGERAAFALCRPPGHHAAADLFGGYCFINNAAVATQAFIDQGAERVALLDVDFHHGNGSQAVFYDRSDIMFLSLHGDPKYAFPHFLGYADETGCGAGEGYNHNYPMGPGTCFSTWGEALADACRNIRNYAPDALVVSLGVDTFEHDPISFFRLTSEDFRRYGATIARLDLPTLFVMEGGYAVDEIGINAVNVLEGYEGR
ncbi:histone deacetylase family protein [Seongchinamella unica]|uniref:Histone deacetylase family protein n=1 Tax=Seongchinamella unica TaxID=2547392 RepID=A0A4R5LRB5_9GAMM|nr:histone deacetylase family protein [Seongchinamella unica]TDG13360.1 histone deacetylase family protein [Seongchinamella unica]